MAEILIVDDERALRESLKLLLTGEGFDVRTARDGADALRRIGEKRPDLVLLDVMMPKMNGFRACEEIRKTDRLLPIVFLTAKDSEADQVRGIGLGADDYVSKDAGEAVLLARVNRSLTRAGDYAHKPRFLKVGAASINENSLVVTGGKPGAVLTKTQYAILSLLASRPGRYFSKDEIIAAVRGEGYACEDVLIYTHIHNLRAKLGDSSEALITDWCLGYKLVK